MKAFFSIIIFLLVICSSTLTAASNTFLDYQNYNHGYCPDCNCAPCKCSGERRHASDDPVKPESTCPTPDPCSPPATSTCTECGLNIYYVGLGIAVLAAAAAIIVSSDNGSTPSHGHAAP